MLTYSVGDAAKPVSEDIALILGDALYNYRACLDHLAWHLVTTAGQPRRPQDVYYPVISNKDRFPAELLKKLPGVSELVGSVIRRHQPFQNGAQWDNHPIWILNQWNASDKHRVVPIVATNAMKVTLEVPGAFRNFEVAKVEAIKDSGYLTPGTDLLRIMGKRKDSTKDHGVMVKISGEAGIAHEGRSVEATLDIIDGAVDDVLTEFERLP